jgi:hypothetical protein
VTVIVVDRRAPSISRRDSNSYMSERKADGGRHGHVDYPPQGKGLGRMAKRAKDFAASPDLRETMAKAGVESV